MNCNGNRQITNTAIMMLFMICLCVIILSHCEIQKQNSLSNNQYGFDDEYEAIIGHGTIDDLKSIHHPYTFPRNNYISTLSSRPFNETFTIFTTMNSRPYYLSLINYTIPKYVYAKYHNYSFIYHPITLNIDEVLNRPTNLRPSEYIFTARYYAMLNLLLGNITVPSTEWFVYMDSDSFMGEVNIPLSYIVDMANNWAKETYPNDDNNDSNHLCDVIYQDNFRIINSGFFMIRNTSWGLNFIQSLLNEFHESYFDYVWTYDQGGLQSVILKLAAKSTNQTIDPSFCWKVYSNQIPRQKCWKEQMEKLKLSQNGRKYDKLCLLPDHLGAPLRFHCHDCNTHFHQNALLGYRGWRLGDLIFHEKDGAIGKVNFEFIRYIVFYQYDYITRKIVYPDGVLIKLGYHDRYNYMMINNTLRMVPSMTYEAMNFKHRDVICLEPHEFNRFPIGPPMPVCNMTSIENCLPVENRYKDRKY